MTNPRPRWAFLNRTGAAGGIAKSLSGRLLVLTIAFVMLGEVLIFVPSIAAYRENWLQQRLAAGQIASLALEAATDHMVSAELEKELLANAEVLTVTLRRNDRRQLMLSGEMPPPVDVHFDLSEAGPLTLIADAFAALVRTDNRVIRVIGAPQYDAGKIIEIVLYEAPLRTDMLAYSGRIVTLSIIISLIAASLVFVSLTVFLVQPMRRITESMVAFRQHPEDLDRVIVPSGRADEIGTAERELAAMQTEVHEALRQKTRLAALGAAVSKINHDLRNILASAQLLSDRIGASEDPTVQRVAPKLFAAMDRAIALCTDTLKYGRAAEPPPRRRPVRLAEVIDDVGGSIAIPAGSAITWRNEIPANFVVDADPDQLFRIVMNLGRNSVEALEGTGKGGEVRFTAEREGAIARLCVADTGPGLPERARAHLFEPFSGSVRAGGTGLGLAIAAELTRAHGGDITLVRSDGTGTVFELTFPDRVAASDAGTPAASGLEAAS